MQYGFFLMPLHAPEKPLADAYDEDVDLLIRADRLGYTEAWIGEHFTAQWENIPAPDLLMAKVSALTERIRLGTGVACLPYQHPLVVAHRIAFLDHLTRGRILFGVGTGSVPTDLQAFGIDAGSGEQRPMMREAIDLIERVWQADGPFEYEGRYWQVRVPAPHRDMSLGFYLKPYQRPTPPIAVAGVSPRSESLDLAGERGWIPMSINFAQTRTLLRHWEAYEQGAARGGRTADRAEWRIAREIYVAETTEQARHEALTCGMARAFNAYMRPFLAGLGALGMLKTGRDMPDEAITPEWLVDNLWIVGSPDDVATKLRALYDEVGGFGTILLIGHDWTPREKWLRSVALFAEEVAPRLADLTGRPAARV
ncbi:MAG TPA: LLM class flavin-dependent oxidoreductase [Dehalococcoidia bacterium]|nr:LLM class flavin-dependent oxidoreductase [Dehalococcoidia bacterium]